MKKLIAVVLVALAFLTSGLASLDRFLPDTDGYIDRAILCRWIGAGGAGGPMLETVGEGQRICLAAFSEPTHYQYRKNCVSKCEPLAIARQIVEGAKETAVAIRERVRLIFASRQQS